MVLYRNGFDRDCFAVRDLEEQSLGTGVRIVYLHGVWVWAALLGLAGAALVGALALIGQRDTWHRWSGALARTGLFFWISYIPLSMWAAQVNWNGLFLAEPRWRVAFVFAVGVVGHPVGHSAGGELADQLDLECVLLRGFDVCPQPGSGSDASGFADLHLRLFAHSRFLHWPSSVDHTGSMAVDALVVWAG